jgi:CBS domain-containing protein
MPTRPVDLAARPDSADDDPLVTQLMTHRVVGIVPEADPMVALRLMATAGLRHLPVLEGGRCIGIVGEADVLRSVAEHPASALDGPPPPVGELCRTVPRLDVADRRSVAARSMHAAGVDAALVAHGDRLLGIVTATDLIRSLAQDAPAASAT